MSTTGLTRRKFAVTLLGGVGTLSGCGDSSPAGLAQPGEHIPYGESPDQFGELRLPNDPGPHRVLVIVHGGFWRAAYDLKHLYAFSAAFTDAGWATWSIEYRRIGQAGGGWPGTFLDVGLAVDALRNLAGRFPLDLNSVSVIGHSAGGQLALWAAARHRIAAASAIYQKNALPVAKAISLAGVCDLRRAWELKLGGSVVGELLGGTPEEVPDRYAAASPAELLPFGIPQVLEHGRQDTGVPIPMSETYQKLAMQRGDDARLVEFPNAGHFELINPEWSEFFKVIEVVS